MKFVGPEKLLGRELLTGFAFEDEENEHYRRARELVHLIRKQRGLK